MKAPRGVSRLIAGCFGLALFSMAGTVKAAIIVDPGPVGGEFFAAPEFTISPDEFVGAAFHIVWVDMKHIELFPGTYEIFLSSSSLGMGPFSVFLTDEFGADRVVAAIFLLRDGSLISPQNQEE